VLGGLSEWKQRRVLEQVSVREEEKGSFSSSSDSRR
jgi:hypothetical protein